MPLLSVIAIRSSLCFLCVGSLLGLGIAVCRVFGLPYFLYLFQAHWPMMLVGWLLQFSFAVAYWMFPKFGTERPNPRLTAGGLVLLNLGCLSAALLGSGGAWIAVTAGTLLLLCAIGPRIKPHFGRP